METPLLDKLGAVKQDALALGGLRARVSKPRDDRAFIQARS
ncbi:MAG TPA: hypothetical protein V6D11_06140 [Waterburya sp.]